MYKEGHIPSAANVPMGSLINPDTTFKSPEEIAQILKGKGFQNPEFDPTIVSCFKGVQACVVGTAFDILGNKNVKVYDGSYEEYSQRQQKK